MHLQKLISDILCYKKRGVFVFCKTIKCRLLRIFGVLQLEKIFICPSYICNADCAHCYEKFPRQNFKQALTTEQIKNIIDQFRNLGGCRVYFCSGEFLLRPDALDIIKYARSSYMAVSVTTNGILLDEEKIENLKVAGLTDLIVSLDSSDPNRHDLLRGVKGCFNKAVNGLRIAREKGINVYIWTYVSKSNFNELEGIVKLGAELNVKEIFVFFTLLSGHLFNKDKENLSYEERELLRRRFNNRSRVCLEFQSESDYCIGGGFRHICVMPSGDVTFCPPVPYSYGNIGSKQLKDCLKNIKSDYNRFSHCTGQCIVNFAEYRETCNAKFLYE